MVRLHNTTIDKLFVESNQPVKPITKKEKDLNESVKPLVTDSFGNLTKSKVQKDLTKTVFYCF